MQKQGHKEQHRRHQRNTPHQSRTPVSVHHAELVLQLQNDKDGNDEPAVVKPDFDTSDSPQLDLRAHSCLSSISRTALIAWMRNSLMVDERFRHRWKSGAPIREHRATIGKARKPSRTMTSRSCPSLITLYLREKGILSRLGFSNTPDTHGMSCWRSQVSHRHSTVRFRVRPFGLTNLSWRNPESFRGPKTPVPLPWFQITLPSSLTPRSCLDCSAY